MQNHGTAVRNWSWGNWRVHSNSHSKVSATGEQNFKICEPRRSQDGKISGLWAVTVRFSLIRYTNYPRYLNCGGIIAKGLQRMHSLQLWDCPGDCFGYSSPEKSEYHDQGAIFVRNKCSCSFPMIRNNTLIIKQRLQPNIIHAISGGMLL